MTFIPCFGPKKPTALSVFASFCGRSGPVSAANRVLTIPAPQGRAARIQSQQVGGPSRTEPLDHESGAIHRQRGINPEKRSKGCKNLLCSAATRGQSWSRAPRKPQNESVKKNLVIESFESSVESFARLATRLLRRSAQPAYIAHDHNQRQNEVKTFGRTSPG